MHYSTVLNREQETPMTTTQIAIVRQRSMWRVQELAALAREIAQTERLPEKTAWRKAQQELASMMAYAREWDEAQQTSKRGRNDG